MDLVVRHARQEDAPGLARLYRQLIHDAGDESSVSSTLADISKDPWNRIWVAELEESVVATCQTVIFPSALRQSSLKALIEAVVVDANFRQQGIATQLLSTAISELGKEEVFRVYITSRADRSAGHRLYQRLGFAQWAVGFSLDLSAEAGP